jgi:hypothetical protein
VEIVSVHLFLSCSISAYALRQLLGQLHRDLPDIHFVAKQSAICGPLSLILLGKYVFHMAPKPLLNTTLCIK